VQIHRAAERGDLAGIEFCLSRGVSIEQHDDWEKNTPLIMASKGLERSAAMPRASIETLRFLLARGAKADAPGWNGHTALHAAAAACDVAAVELLREHGANVRHVSDSKYTALHSVAHRLPSPRKQAMLAHLAKCGVPLDIVTDYGESALSVCAYFGDFDAIRLLLDAGADPQPLQWTPLFHAIAFGDAAEFERALAATSDHCARDRWEQTALLFALGCGDVAKAQRLRAAGYDLSARARCGKTALMIATERNHHAAASWILENGASPGETDDFGGTALMGAATRDALECVDLLLRHGADPDAENRVQSKAIHHAGALRVIARLVRERPAQINAVDGCGEWPLKHAAEENDVALLEGLLAIGATVDQTSTGATALHAAINRDAREAAARLIEKGANVNAGDVDGQTPIFNVRSREALTLLLEAGADPAAEDQAAMTAADFIRDPLVKELLPRRKMRRR
jgi:ankyrin repeat protein